MSEVIKLTATANITVRTSEIRFVKRLPDNFDGYVKYVLQQLYKNLHTGESEWRDVECIDEPTESSTNVKP